MGTWGTYDLRDMLMFAPETYYRLFERMNEAAWPLPIVMLGLGIGITLLLLRPSPPWRGRLAVTLLAPIWLWVAGDFHLQRYAPINWAAPGFAALFGAEALLFVWIGLIRRRRVVGSPPQLVRRIGLSLIGLGLAGYPLLNPLLGHGWERAEWFGQAPDPTAVATLGLLLLAGGKGFWSMYMAPVVWCFISGATLWALQTPLAFLPLMAALLALATAAGTPRRTRLSRYD